MTHPHTLAITLLASTLWATTGCLPNINAESSPAGEDAAFVDARPDAGPALCLVNQRVVDGACDPCPSGATNDPGDDTSGPDTECEVALCSVDAFVSSGSCKPCPNGETNSEGDLIAGPDTTCDGDCEALLGLPCGDFVQADLESSNPAPDDAFGADVALDGDTLVVGVPNEDSAATGVDGDVDAGLARNSGAAYVFVRTDSTWTQQAYLKASNTGTLDLFGSSVAISGDTIVIGAPGEGSNAIGTNGDQSDDSVGGSGAAYVFTRVSGVWTQVAYLKPPVVDAEDAFGAAVAIDSGLIAISAPGDDSAATGVDGDGDLSSNSGAVHLFFADVANGWEHVAYLKASNGGRGDRLGTSVAVRANTVAAGAVFEDVDNSGIPNSGAAYVFRNRPGGWAQEAYLKASDPTAQARFGTDVALGADGDTLVVGASQKPSGDSSNGAGAAYVFTRVDADWSEPAKLEASNPDADDRFGSSVSIDGDRLVVGAAGEAGFGVGLGGDPMSNDASYADAGAVYLFELTSPGVWDEVAYIKSSSTSGGDTFGAAVSLRGGTLVVGAPGDEGRESVERSGAVHVRQLSP